jgi:xanthosine utilization system XapX-like protein
MAVGAAAMVKLVVAQMLPVLAEIFLVGILVAVQICPVLAEIFLAHAVAVVYLVTAPVVYLAQ